MGRRLLKVGIALGVAGIVYGACLVAGNVWGRSQLAAIESARQQEEVRQSDELRAMRMPVLRGQPLDEACIPKYAALVNKGNLRRTRTIVLGDFMTAALRPPTTPLPDDVRSLVSDYEPDIDALRDATRCTRVDEPPRADVDYWFRFIPDAVQATSYLLGAAHLHAQSGDERGAFERYLDALRFTEDAATARDGGSVQLTFVATAALLLGQYIVSRDTSSDQLSAADAALARLDAALPSAGQFVARWKILPLDTGDHISLDAYVYEFIQGSQRIGARMTTLLLPHRALAAMAAREHGAGLDAMFDAAAKHDHARFRELAAQREVRSMQAYNPLLALTLHGPMVAADRRTADCAHGALALVRGAIQLERAGWKDGAFSDSGTIALGLDPAADSGPLHHESRAEGRGYRIWSAGANGKDDGGISARSSPCMPLGEGADDLALERIPK